MFADRCAIVGLHRKRLTRPTPLEEIAVRSNQTEMPIEPVLASSRPPPGMLEHRRRLYERDAASQANSFGMGARLKDGAVWVAYPMSLLVWRK